jgi:hypothetical protein
MHLDFNEVGYGAWTMARGDPFSGMVALMIALCASVVLASAHQCSGRPCTGTGSANTLYERAGRDVLRADTHTRDRDRLYGNRGKDRLNVDDGDMRDTVSGGPGFDVCIADTTVEIGVGCERVRAGVLPPP